MRILIFLLLGIILKTSGFSQNLPNTLEINQLLEIVRKYHPVVKQTSLNIDKTKAEILIARGAFDPFVSNYLAGKTFENSNYYDYVNPNITIPTWYGADIIAGVENLSGNRFDVSETEGGTSYVGVSIPLLKNLVMDKRRGYLKQARIYNSISKIEQEAVINNIFFDAALQYWEWTRAYEIYQIIKSSLEINTLRYALITKTILNGERPAIDSVEALSQLQNFQFLLNESLMNFQNESIALNAFLWQENDVPVEIPLDVTPFGSLDDIGVIARFDINLDNLILQARQLHPELRIYNQKLNVLELDRKIKFQEILPKLDFNYVHLSKGYNAFASDGFLFQNNYQYGLKFEMPLLLSQGRGAYKVSKLKIQETQLSQNQKAQQIELKIRQYYNEFNTLKTQIALFEEIMENQRQLLAAEETRFENGESSLFLINSRENKLLESQQKLVDLRAKYFKSVYALQWSSGLLN